MAKFNLQATIDKELKHHIRVLQRDNDRLSDMNKKQAEKIAELEGVLKRIYSKTTKTLAQPNGNDTKVLVELATLIDDNFDYLTQQED